MNISRLFAGHLVWRSAYLLTSTLVTILMARYLEAAATGWVFYLISWYSFFFLVATVGMDASITYFVSSGKAGSGEMLRFSVTWVLLVGLLSAFISFLFLQIPNQHLSLHSTQWSAVFFITGNVLITFLNALFYSKKDFITPNVLFFAVNLFLILWLSYGIAGQQLTIGPFVFLEVYFFLIFLQGVLSLILFLMKNKLPISFSWPNWSLVKQIVVYSGIAYLANLSFFACTRVDYWILELYNIQEASLGNYIQASRLVQLFQLIPAMIASAIFPLAAAGYDQLLKDGMLKLVRLLFLFYLVPVLLLIVTGNWLFPFLFGTSFGEMYTVFLYLLPGLFSLAGLSFISACFAAINKIILNLKISVAGMLMIVAGDFLLIPEWGITGAALVSSAGYLFCFIMGLWFFTKETGLSWMEFFRFRFSDFSFLRSVMHRLISKNNNTPS